MRRWSLLLVPLLLAACGDDPAGPIAPPDPTVPPSFAFTFGTEGAGPGDFAAPFGVRLAPDGRVFVADQDNDRIQVYR